MNELTLAQNIVIWALPILFAITLHEVAHGWVASKLGDQTAKLLGRLSLNPIKHIDFLGTVVIPLILIATTQFIFGWAKPVPVNLNYLNKPKRDMALVALAGPLANIAMAFFWGFIAKLGLILEATDNMWSGTPLYLMGMAGIQINVMLAVLNLLPLPPLDGANIMSGFLPRKMAYQFNRIQPYGFFVLLLLMFSGVLFAIMFPPVLFFIRIIRAIYNL
jgi:Zn-dependent protease